MPENLKNVLLFMASSGYLVPPSKDPSQENLWVETWKRIDRFLPDLRKDLSLDEEEEEKEEEKPVASEKAPQDMQAAPEEKAPVQSEIEVEKKEKVEVDEQ